MSLPPHEEEPQAGSQDIINRLRGGPGAGHARLPADLPGPPPERTHHNLPVTRVEAPPPPGLMDRWFKAKPMPWAALAVAGLLAVGALFVASGPLRPSDSAAPGPQKLVGVYLTDAPDGTRYAFTIASVTLGPKALHLPVEVREVVISDHQGPDEAVRIASARVDRAVHGDVTIRFASARVDDGTGWRPVPMPRSVLTVEDAVEATPGARQRVLFDVSLEDSFRDDGDGLVFAPTVAGMWRVSESASTTPRAGPGALFPESARVDEPAQRLLDAAEAGVDERADGSDGPPATGASRTTTATTGSSRGTVGVPVYTRTIASAVTTTPSASLPLP